jgi:hypothetical protein
MIDCELYLLPSRFPPFNSTYTAAPAADINRKNISPTNFYIALLGALNGGNLTQRQTMSRRIYVFTRACSGMLRDYLRQNHQLMQPKEGVLCPRKLGIRLPPTY